VTTGPGIIIDHDAHMKKNISCTLCHNRVAHPGYGEYEDFMTMEACFRCHVQEPDGKKEHVPEELAATYNFKAPGKCEACHPKDFQLKPADHPG